MPRPINRASDMNLMKLIERFDSDDKCRLTLEKLRWPTGVRCIRSTPTNCRWLGCVTITSTKGRASRC